MIRLSFSGFEKKKIWNKHIKCRHSNKTKLDVSVVVLFMTGGCHALQNNIYKILMIE